MSAEANRMAAEQWLQRARERHEAGDDEAALKFCDKSLKLCESAAAQKLAEHIRKYGAGSPAAQAVAKVLAAADHYEVLQLPRTATEAEVKRAYKKLSLTLHPDRNHANGAENAFKRLAESYSIVSGQSPLATPREGMAAAAAAPAAAPPPAASSPPQQSSSPPANGEDGRTPGSGDAAPTVGPPRRRRRWERALGLGKKRSSSVER